MAFQDNSRQVEAFSALNHWLYLKVQVQVHSFTLIQLQYNNDKRKKRRSKNRANYTLKKVCISQKSQAFELPTTTERLQVGGGYTVLIKN